MTLRGVHVLFIVVSALLAVFVAGWAATLYHADQNVGYAAGSVVSLAAAAGLARYAAVFLRKTRRFS
jgi:hypothetical protein